MMRKMMCLGLLWFILITGCRSREVAVTALTPVTVPKIGLSFDSFVIERWKRDRDTFVSRINELGGEVYVQNANGDANKQIDQVNYFIEQQMDAIVIVCADNQLLTESVKRAKAAEIPVIAYDRLIKDANVDLFITFNNEQVGALMAQSMIEHLPQDGKMAVIFGSPVDGNVNQVEVGFERIMQDSQIQILNQQYADGWLAEIGFQVISQDLQEGIVYDGICCGNDDVASQVIRALSEYRMAGEVWVVGQDADLSACQRIVEGTQGMTVYKPVDQQAKLAAEAAFALIDGMAVDTERTFFDGTYEIAYIELDPIAVTKENIDQIIIGDHYHLRDEVYLNLKNQ